MNVWLMYQDRDFDPQAPLPERAGAVAQDLELEAVFDAMAGADAFLRQVARPAVLTGLADADAIGYRQRIFTDCLRSPTVIRELYALAVEAIEREKKAWGWVLTRYPEGVLLRSIETLRQFTGMLSRLRQVAVEHRSEFGSEGFVRLFEMLERELSDDYLHSIEEHLRRLGFREGVRVSAALGQGNKGVDYVLREPPSSRAGWGQRLRQWRERLMATERTSHVYQVADRDEAGLRALAELRSQAISTVAAALGRSSDHILAFFGALRVELGFYVGCLNLHERLTAKGLAICLPAVLPAGTPALSAAGLYDISLALRAGTGVVGNDLAADGKRLIMVTGANRGGKSTLLRSLGQAQLMMQAGLFVPARSFRAEMCPALFTHFKREEDAGMRSGKLDEELARMSRIVDQIKTGGMILLNESFASTNEREGSEIARQIVTALLDCGVRVVYVTHLFDLAQRLFQAGLPTALFLRAQRLPDGTRTFKVLPGEPIPTSYGEDLYRRIFQPAAAAQAATLSRAG